MTNNTTMSTLPYPETPRSVSSTRDKCNAYLCYSYSLQSVNFEMYAYIWPHLRCIQSCLLLINVQLCGLIIRKSCWNVVNSTKSNQHSDTSHTYPAFQFFRFRLRDGKATLKLGLLTQKWGGWKCFFVVTLYNFQKGGGRLCSPAPFPPQAVWLFY